MNETILNLHLTDSINNSYIHTILRELLAFINTHISES